jgi:hypothetical protein
MLRRGSGRAGHEEFSMSQKKLGFSAAAFVAICAWLPVNAAHAYTFEAGGHGGVNLDLHGDLHLGVDLLFPLAQLSPSVQRSGRVSRTCSSMTLTT